MSVKFLVDTVVPSVFVPIPTLNLKVRIQSTNLRYWKNEWCPFRILMLFQNLAAVYLHKLSSCVLCKYLEERIFMKLDNKS
jgi:hypothetical protein